MSRVALTLEQKKKYKIRDLAGRISGRMHMLGIKQKDLAEALDITQQAVCNKLSPKTYKENENADPFSYGELLIVFDVLEFSQEERARLLTL